jgi:acyl carrier protein
METIIKRTRQHIAESILMVSSTPLGGDDSLLAQGILDSLAVLELVEFLQREFQIQIGGDELLPENLDTLNRIAAFVARKRLNAGGA